MKKNNTEIIDELQLHNLLMKGILGSSPAGIMAFNSVREENNSIIDFEWILFNDAAEKIIKISREKLIGKYLLIEMPNHMKDGLFEKYVKVVETEEPLNTEHYFEHEKLKLWLYITAVKYHDGLIVSFSDITNKKTAEEERNLFVELLIKNENKLKRIVENISDALMVDDVNGNLVFANKQFKDLFGFGDELIYNIKMEDYVAPEHLTELKLRHTRRINGEDVPDRYEYTGLRKDGERINLEVKVVVIKDENGKIIGTQSAIKDITHKKQSELKVKYLNRVYAVLSNINQAIVRLNDVQKVLDEACRIAVDEGKFKLAWIGLIEKATGKIRIVSQYGYNKGFIEKLNSPTHNFMTGIGPAGIAIRSGKYFVCNDIEHHEIMTFSKVEALNRGFRSNIALPLKVTGEIIGNISLYSGETDFFNDEEVKLLEELAMDLSYAIESIQNEQKKRLAESRLKESEVRFRTAFETSPIGMILTGIDGKLLEVNTVFCKMLGYSKEELLYMSFISLTHPDDRDKNMDYFNKMMQDIPVEMSFEKRYLHKDGHIVWVNISTSLIKNESGHPLYFITCIEDITSHKKYEEEILNSEMMLRYLVDSNPDSMILCDTDGNIIYANQTFYHKFESDEQNQEVNNIYNLLDAELNVYLKDGINQVLKNGISERSIFKYSEKAIEIFINPVMNSANNIYRLVIIISRIKTRVKSVN